MVSDDSVFEQNFIHARHNESQQMWMIGIWLASFASLMKTFFDLPENNTKILFLGILHLIFTFIVLLYNIKLTLEFTRRIIVAHAVLKNHKDTKRYYMKGLWETNSLPTFLKGIGPYILSLNVLTPFLLISGMGANIFWIFFKNYFFKLCQLQEILVIILFILITMLLSAGVKKFTIYFDDKIKKEIDPEYGKET